MWLEREGHWGLGWRGRGGGIGGRNRRPDSIGKRHRRIGRENRLRGREGVALNVQGLRKATVRRFRSQYRWWQGWAQTGGECVRNEVEERFGRAGGGLVAGIAGVRGRGGQGVALKVAEWTSREGGAWCTESTGTCGCNPLGCRCGSVSLLPSLLEGCGTGILNGLCFRARGTPFWALWCAEVHIFRYIGVV